METRPHPQEPSDNPITRLLAQATMHAQNEQRSLSNDSNKAMNPQEMLLMQMLKAPEPNKEEEPEQEEEDDTAPANPHAEGVEIDRSTTTDSGAKVRYDARFLLELELSPLVLPPSYWESELPPIEFFRLNKGSPADARRERRRSSNNRRGSAVKKDKALLDDIKKENANNNNNNSNNSTAGAGREDRRTQRARQRENKKRGKLDNSAIEEGDEDSNDAPEWMKEQDTPTGNSMLDFEIWRLKMRIETAKRNGEEISADDMAEYAKLKSKIDGPKNSEITEETETTKSKVDIDENNAEATAQSVNNIPNQLEQPQTEEKVHRSVDDQFDLPLSTNSNTGATGSHFSSFFSSEPRVESSPNEASNRSSRLMSILSDENQNPAAAKSPLQTPQFLASQPQVQPNQQQQRGQPQMPMMMPMNNASNDKNQLFLQSLLSKSMGLPQQQGEPQVAQQNQQQGQQFQRAPMNQMPPNGMDPRMMQGFPLNMQFFPPNMPMPMNGMQGDMQGGMPLQQRQHFQQNPNQQQQQHHPQEQQQQNGNRQQNQYQRQQRQNQNQQQHQQQQQHHHQQYQQQRNMQQPQQPQLPNQQPPAPVQQQNLPYGNNAGAMPGMTPNHPLMMLLNKNKRKSTANDTSGSNTSSPSNSTPQTPIQQQAHQPNMPMPGFPPNGQNNMQMPPYGYPPYTNGMNMNGMNMNGMNMNMNGVNMNGMNMMNMQQNPGANQQQQQQPGSRSHSQF